MKVVCVCRHSVPGVSCDGELKDLVVLYDLKRSVVLLRVGVIYYDWMLIIAFFKVMSSKWNFK